MGFNTETQRGGSCPLDLTVVHKEKAGGTIAAHRLVTIASDGDVEQATANATDVHGVLHSAYTGKLNAVAGDLVSVGVLRQTVVADVAVVAGQSLKAAEGGKVIQFVDSELSGDTIEDNVGVAFTNQPANDGVEVVSDNAADTTQTVTIYYTRNGTPDTVSTETKTLNGTTQVSFTHTDIDLVLAVEKSAATTGTITFREASGNATITTLAAGTLTAGKIAVTAGQTLAYNVAPTVVADAGTTKQVGLIGTNSAGTTIYDSQALTGAVPATMNVAFRTVTFLLVGDLEVARTVTAKVGAEDNQRLYVGYSLEAGVADGLMDAFILPNHVSAGDIALLDGVTTGVVTASKAVVVDSNKDIGDFRNLDGVNLDAGASGTAGTVDIFPGTAAKGKVALTAADSAGDTTTTIVNASQGGARTYTIPDAGASASFVMTEGAQTKNGKLTLGAASFALNGAAAAAGSQDTLVVRKTGIADNTATDVITVTVPNANHNAAIELLILAHLGTGTDASESSRCATGIVVLARTTGVATVAAASTLAQAQIATVAGGGTLTLAYGVSAMTGAAGATQTFTIQLTLVVTGTITDHTAVVSARLLNSLGTGVTMAAS